MRFLDDEASVFLRWLRGLPDPDVARIPVVAVTAFYEDYPPTRATKADLLPERV